MGPKILHNFSRHTPSNIEKAEHFGYSSLTDIFINMLEQITSTQPPKKMSFSIASLLGIDECQKSEDTSSMPSSSTEIGMPKASSSPAPNAIQADLREADKLERGRLSPITSTDSESSFDEQDGQKKKKARTNFTAEQVCELERQYAMQRYIPNDERSLLAEKLQLSDQQVKTWFQNRRMKEKRQRDSGAYSPSFQQVQGQFAQQSVHHSPQPMPFQIFPNGHLPTQTPVTMPSSFPIADRNAGLLAIQNINCRLPQVPVTASLPVVSSSSPFSMSYMSIPSRVPRPFYQPAAMPSGYSQRPAFPHAMSMAPISVFTGRS